MKLCISVKFSIPLALLVGCIITDTVSAAFVVPNSATSPFEDWSRNAADSSYAEWNTFTVPVGAPGNAPDVGSFGPSGANLVQNATSAFLTSSGNIYSFAEPTDFDITLPNYGYGTGYSTRVVAQVATLGSPLLQSSLSLSYFDGSQTQLAPLTSATVVSTPGQGTNDEWMIVWDVPSYNPLSFSLEFKASGSSMSFDRLAVDTFAQAVPEPEAIALAILGVCGLCFAVWRRRSRLNIAQA